MKLRSRSESPIIFQAGNRDRDRDCNFLMKIGIAISILVIGVNKQGHALKNWVEGLSEEAFYPWESPKKILT